MRVLVAIAHHGTKNRSFFERMVRQFESMPLDVDIVALIEHAKPLPAGVEARIGAPESNPWSLPFSHRQLFADRRDDYDLFIYSEDDTLITYENVVTFLELSDALPDRYLPGFMRYEVDEAGRRSYCSVHSHYRWEPDSTFCVDDLHFARFTNEHGACYALTRGQLKKAIASGGFLVAPHEGPYDMLVTAATDVYVQCGFTKVFCLDRREGQLVHHMPNIYLGRLGVPPSDFDAMWEAISTIARGEHDGAELTRPETRMVDQRWARHCYPTASLEALLQLIPQRSRVLSVGTSHGRIEEAIASVGHEVTAVPIDSVFGLLTQTRSGVSVTDPQLPPADRTTATDVVLALDILHYLPDPAAALERLRRQLRPGGLAVITVPNHRRHDLRHHLTAQPGPSKTPRDFGQDGMHWTDANVIREWYRRAGLGQPKIRPRRATAESLLEGRRLDDLVTGNILLAIGSAI